jgi:hypothetical protein
MSKGSCKDIDSEEREPMIDTAVILKRFEEPDEFAPLTRVDLKSSASAA